VKQTSFSLGDELEYLGETTMEGRLRTGAIGRVVELPVIAAAAYGVDFGLGRPVFVRPSNANFQWLNRARADFVWENWTATRGDRLEYIGETTEWLSKGAIGIVTGAPLFPVGYCNVDFGTGDLNVIRPGHPHFRKLA
jgi:hypothetical protein